MDAAVLYSKPSGKGLSDNGATTQLPLPLPQLRLDVQPRLHFRVESTVSYSHRSTDDGTSASGGSLSLAGDYCSPHAGASCARFVGAGFGIDHTSLDCDGCLFDGSRTWQRSFIAHAGFDIPLPGSDDTRVRIWTAYLHKFANESDQFAASNVFELGAGVTVDLNQRGAAPYCPRVTPARECSGRSSFWYVEFPVTLERELPGEVNGEREPKGTTIDVPYPELGVFFSTGGDKTPAFGASTYLDYRSHGEHSITELEVVPRFEVSPFGGFLTHAGLRLGGGMIIDRMSISRGGTAPFSHNETQLGAGGDVSWTIPSGANVFSFGGGVERMFENASKSIPSSTTYFLRIALTHALLAEH